jgi:hypothetical protein
VNGTIVAINSTLPEDIWIFPTRTVTGGNITQVTQPVNITDANIDDIALMVITYEIALGHIQV